MIASINKNKARGAGGLMPVKLRNAALGDFIRGQACLPLLIDTTPKGTKNIFYEVSMMNKPNSKVVAKLRNDEMVLSAKLNIHHPIVAAQVAMAGFDLVWADMEHIPVDYNEVNQVFLAAKAYGAETIVRVARGSYSDHVRPLEMDCTAVMVPHVLSAEDAKKVAYMTKFHPLGRRAIDGGFADGLYCKMGTADYIEYANNERLTVIQIEDFEALEEIEET